MAQAKALHGARGWRCGCPMPTEGQHKHFLQVLGLPQFQDATAPHHRGLVITAPVMGLCKFPSIPLSGIEKLCSLC